MNLFIKTLSPVNAYSQKELQEIINARDLEIIEKFKQAGSPVGVCKLMNNRVNRWVVVRVLTRAGLWNTDTKELMRQKRCANVDYEKAAYYERSKSFKNESMFQDKIAALLKSKSINFKSEEHLGTTYTKARADFVGNDFVIEAKITVKHDDLCRGLGQCITYKKVYPSSRIAVVYPDDLNAGDFITKCFVDTGFSLIPFSHLEKWLP